MRQSRHNLLETPYQQVTYIWDAPWTFVKALFLINRYGNLIGQTFLMLEETGYISHNSQRVYLPSCSCITCRAQSNASFVRPLDYTAHALQSSRENQFAVSTPVTLQRVHFHFWMTERSFGCDARLCDPGMQAQHCSVGEYAICSLCRSYPSGVTLLVKGCPR